MQLIIRIAVTTLLPNLGVAMESQSIQSLHLGFLHPNGVDVVGLSTEKKISGRLYQFYNFGIPSFAALGINYYGTYTGNGLNATAGVGLGSIAYSSATYQWRVGKFNYVKFGIGYTTGIDYNGLFPALAYEHRMDTQ